jgi:pectin methylesterase-like acyl-CoA thioesterase
MRRILVITFVIALLGAFGLSQSTAEAATTHWVDILAASAAPGTGCGASAGYSTIGAAVAAAAPGDTVEVCAGTYAEEVNLTKMLTLRGAQAGVDACGRVAANESIVTGPGALLATIELDTGSAGSVIDGFTFSGNDFSIRSDTGPIDNLQIINNRIRGFTGSGVFLDDSGVDITMHHNEVDGTLKVGPGDLVHLDTDNFDGF